MSQITVRQEQILKIIVREYVQNGQPIGSKTLVDTYKLDISPATVRNEMAALEKQGYLAHPHTSAGRVPTELGYRYFVRKLMDETELRPDEKLMIQHQFHQARLELDQWMRLSAAVLAHTTESASWVTSPKISECRVKHVELISIHDHVALLILVLKEGTIKQQILNLDMPHTQDELRTISRYLTELWTDADTQTVTATSSNLTGLENQICQVVLSAMHRINRRELSDMYHDGLLHIIETNDWNRENVLQQVVRMLEERQLVDQLIGQVTQEQGVQIIIGGEGIYDDISQVSIVLSRYGVNDGATGVLGVMGSTRMRYGRAVSIVRYMSYLMSDLMVDLYGLSPES